MNCAQETTAEATRAYIIAFYVGNLLYCRKKKEIVFIKLFIYIIVTDMNNSSKLNIRQERLGYDDHIVVSFINTSSIPTCYYHSLVSL